MIAIDPGPVESAWLRYRDGRIHDMAIQPNHEVLSMLRAHRNADDGEPVVIEMVSSFGMAVGRDVFETVYYIGRFAEAACTAERIERKAIKLHLCGNTRAKDANIRQALIDRFGGVGGKQAAVGTKKAPGPLYGVRKHLWAALAVAVTYEDTTL